MNPSSRREFDYDTGYKLQMLSTSLLIMSGPILMGIYSWGGDSMLGLIFFLLWLSGSICVSTLLILGMASIALDDGGVSSYLFRIKTKYIPWSNVIEVNVSNNPYDDKKGYSVFDAKTARFYLVNTKGGPICFRGNINDRYQLVNAINESAERYRFRLTASGLRGPNETKTELERL